MATLAIEMPEQEMEWYEHIAGHASSRVIGGAVMDTWREGDKTAAEILTFLVEHKRMVRVEWGGGDVRYYYPGEIEFVRSGSPGSM